MILLDLDTILKYNRYKGKTVEHVIQFNFNYVLWLIKNRDEILVHDKTLDFLIQWSRGTTTGKTYIGSKEEIEIRRLMKERWAIYQYEIEKENQLQDTWLRNREIDKDNKQAYEP